MVHTKFLGNRSTGSGEDLYRFTIFGCCDHLSHVTDIIIYIFISLYLKVYIQNIVFFFIQFNVPFKIISLIETSQSG